MRNITAGTATIAMVATAILVASSAITAAPKHMKKKPAPAASGALIAKGKTISAKCAGCHNTDLGGRGGFTPSIKSTGEIKDYSAAQFARLLDKGIENNGRPLKRMPVMHMAAGDSKALYAYLKTVK